MLRRTAAAFLLLFLAAGPLTADDVFLKNGRKLSGQVTDLGEKIQLKLAGGITVTLAKDQILRIVKKDAPVPPAKKPSPGTPASSTKPKGPARLIATSETSFTTGSPQVESIEFSPDEKVVAIHSAGNLAVQIRNTRDWKTVHEDGLKVVFQKSPVDVLCLKQSRGELGLPVLHRLTKQDKKAEIRFTGALTKGITCTDGAKWVAGWRGTYVVLWDREKPSEPTLQKQIFTSRIYGIYCLPRKEILAAHGDRAWLTMDLKEGNQLGKLDYSKIDDFECIGSAISADRKIIVMWSHDRVATVDPMTLKVKMGEPLDVKFTKRAWISSTGKWLGAVVEGPDSPREYPIAVVSLKTLKPVDLKANLPPVSFSLPNTLFFSEDEKLLGANPNRTTLHIVSCESWEELASYENPGRQILAAGFSPRGRQVLLADDKSTVHVVKLRKE